MWKPPEKQKFEAAPKAWPSHEVAKNSKLFSPLHYQNLSLNHRSWIPAMVPWRATSEGQVTQDVIDWYTRFAKGRPGAIVIEATGIRDIPSGPLLRIGHDRFIPGLKKIVEAVKDSSQGHTKLFIQIIDFLTIRRRPDPNTYFDRHLDITSHHKSKMGLTHEADIRAALKSMTLDAVQNVLTDREFESLIYGYRERVTDTHQPHIAKLPQTLPDLFADAALRAQQAGFDGVELHYAHAYTMASFLSALNTRQDGYGSTLQGRVRLPLEVFHAVRQRVGPDYTLGCRMLAEDCLENGSSVKDAAYFAHAFARAGMDFISLSRGGKFEDAAAPKIGQAIYPYTGPSGYECMPHFISDNFGPFGRNIEPSAQIKAHLRENGLDTPIIAAGGIHDFYQAESILDKGQADIIAIARQALADPDWFHKVFLGQGAAVRVCKYSNYCEGLDQKHKVVTCQLWDRTELDRPDVKRTRDGKRRLTAPDWKA